MPSRRKRPNKPHIKLKIQGKGDANTPKKVSAGKPRLLNQKNRGLRPSVVKASKAIPARTALARLAGPVGLVATATGAAVNYGIQEGKANRARAKEHAEIAQKNKVKNKDRQAEVARNQGSSSGARKQYEEDRAKRRAAFDKRRAAEKKTEGKKAVATTASSGKSSAKSKGGSKSSFGAAFKAARKAGKGQFTWNGKSYATVTSEEVKKAGFSSLREYLNARSSRKEKTPKVVTRAN